MIEYINALANVGALLILAYWWWQDQDGDDDGMV